MLLKQLGVNKNKLSYSFENPADTSRQVYIFPDVPHCMKNLRNHTLDYGMVIMCSDESLVYVTKDLFARLIACDGVSFKLCHKVTPYHREVSGVERQRVRPAMQLF